MTKIKSLICPLSNDVVQENTVRITGFLIALCLVLTLVIQKNTLLWIVTLDYAIRAFYRWPHSPLSWTSKQLSEMLSLSKKSLDKAPKIFAARVGFLFCSTGLLLSFLHPLTSYIIIGTLLLFTLLESLGNICMGCIVYTYIIPKKYKIS